MILIIWYLNFQFIQKIQAKGKEIKTSYRETISRFDSLPKYDFIFKDIKNDPFNISVNITDTIAKAPTMPMFNLKGVVITKGGALALMELADGNVYTLKKGETYLGVKIKDITSKDVTIEFRGKKETLRIWE